MTITTTDCLVLCIILCIATILYLIHSHYRLVRVYVNQRHEMEMHLRLAGSHVLKLIRELIAAREQLHEMRENRNMWKDKWQQGNFEMDAATMEALANHKEGSKSNGNQFNQPH